MDLLRVLISEGNEKLGAIPNVSLLPGVSCAACSKDTCLKGGCYAAKLCKLRPGVARAWATNYLIATQDRPDYFRQIVQWLGEQRPPQFRWHVGGDFLDQTYLNAVKLTAAAYPETSFLAFTKRHELDYARTPANLRILRSCWPTLPLPEMSGPFAWMLDPKQPDPRIPEGTILCPGDCSQCFICWALEPGDHVMFKKH